MKRKFVRRTHSLHKASTRRGCTSQPSSNFRSAVQASAAALLATALGTTALCAQGISYTIAPAATSINWDKDLGLKNHSLYGGQASIDFENLIALQGYYFTNDKIGTAVDKLGLTGSLANQLTNQRLGLRSYGGNVIWKFWKGGVAPFIKTGGGILETRPDSGRRSKQIVLNAGGGLRIGANAPVFVDLFAEDMMLRVDRYALFSQGSSYVPADPGANDLRHNLVLGAAVGIPLGLKDNNKRTEESGDLRWGLSGASLTLEPFAGQMRFDDNSLRDQTLVGARAGIDVGRYVGIRGFYWRGTDDDFKRLESLQSYGGEMQFRLNSSPGLTPYLLAGAAELDFKQSDSSASAQRFDDKFSLILGGGVSLPIGERFSINVAARDYLFGLGNGADSVSSPSDLKNNWMYTAGLRVSVFGHSGSDATDRTLRQQDALSDRVRTDSMRIASMQRNGSRTDTVVVNGRKYARVAGGMAMNDSGLHSTVDSNGVRYVMVDGRRVVLDSAGQPVKSNAATVITLPVPTTGELYVRYGPPSSSAATRPLFAGTAADSAAQRAMIDSVRSAAVNNGDRDAAINRRIDSIVAVRVNERTGNQIAPTSAPPATGTTVIVPPATPPAVVVPPANPPTVVAPQSPVVTTQPRYSWIGNTQSGGLMIYSGVTFNDAAQLGIGARFDLGSLGGTSPIHFAPEIAYASGNGGHSTMIVGNAQYLFGKFRVGSNRMIQPHIVAGVGILNFSDRVGSRDGLEGIINIGYGASIPLTNRPPNRAGPYLTLEHQGIDFFQLNRLLVGLSWRM